MRIQAVEIERKIAFRHLVALNKVVGVGRRQIAIAAVVGKIFEVRFEGQVQNIGGLRGEKGASVSASRAVLVCSYV